jgi:hypothetical protein
MKSKLFVLGIIGMFVFFIGFTAGCNTFENESTSSLRLVIASITGSDIEGSEDSTTVFSDVLTSSGSIINDNATADLNAVLIDPALSTGTTYQDVIVDQIDVSYSRTDGLNVEGKDVPYSFSQKVNAFIIAGGSLDLAFVIVQHTAKGESPLVELSNYPNQEHVLKMEAHVTFYSRDTGGHRLAPVTGSISIWFGNFADDN